MTIKVKPLGIISRFNSTDTHQTRQYIKRSNITCIKKITKDKNFHEHNRKHRTKQQETHGEQKGITWRTKGTHKENTKDTQKETQGTQKETQKEHNRKTTEHKKENKMKQKGSKRKTRKT